MNDPVNQDPVNRDPVNRDPVDETDGARPLLANAPLVLDDPGVAWKIRGGRAEVFAVLHRTNARRVPLFALDEGDWAFPAPPGAAATLLLAGLGPDAEVTTLRLDDGQGGAAAGTSVPPDVALPEARQAMEHWAERLSEAVRDPSPRQGTPLREQRTVELSKGETAWSDRRTRWVQVSSGRQALRLFGAAGFAPEAEPEFSGDELVLLPAAAWVRADSPTRLSVVPGAEALASRAGWEGFEAFQRAALDYLPAVIERRTHALTDALEQRADEEQHLDERVYTRLAQVLEPEHRWIQELPSEHPGDRALGIVAAATGVTLVVPEHIEVSGMDRIDLIARESGVRYRRVTLPHHWWRQDVGALYATVDDGTPVALLPRGSGAMDLVDPETGVRRRVTADLARTVGEQAVMLYRPLPPGVVTRRDVVSMVMRSFGTDLWRVIALGAAIAVLSLATPLGTRYILSSVVPGRATDVLLGLTILLIVVAACAFGFSVVQGQTVARMNSHAIVDLQAALWDRVLDLPLAFFRRHSSGTLARRVMAVDQVQQLATVTVTASALAVPVGLLNLALAFYFEPRLAAFGLIALLAGGAGIFAFTRAQARHLARLTDATQASFGTAMQFVDGMGKLRVANAERRAFAVWASPFAVLKESFVASQRGFAAATAFASAGPALVTLLLFLAVATLPTNTVSAATFIAFNTAFVQALAATIGLTSVAVFFAQSKPLLESVRPVLETPREITASGATPGRLSGSIEVSHVGFRYAADGPLVLDDVSFVVEPGSFVGIVGPTGSGKSTMLRLLLGFERPAVGSVRYDGKDLESLDVTAVRRQIGVVTQSVRLLPGAIYTNIIGNRSLTLDDAWEAAEIAGIADDIRAMPMQMHTFVSEGASTFSGGQRQRLLIARAVAAKPRILLFDEATSALDNRTQTQVAGALTRLHAARVVIAHRLSTIQSADQILVLDQGRIVEAGTFDQLRESGGPFTRLVRRQLI